MSAHVVVPELDTHPGVLRQLEHELSQMGIRHVTVQLETREECVGELCGDEEGSGVTMDSHAGHLRTHR